MSIFKSPGKLTPYPSDGGCYSCSVAIIVFLVSAGVAVAGSVYALTKVVANAF